MAKIEPNTILGSSQDNFIVFGNTNYDKPMATFYFLSNAPSSGSIVIRDALDDDGYSKTIVYDTGQTITDSSFKFSGSRDNNALALFEVLKKNPIFYDLSLVTDVPNVGVVVRTYIDTSTRYSITASQGIVVGGTYSSYTPKEPNKFVLMLNGADKQISLEKYTMAEDVAFNVTAPFEHLSFKEPFQLRMMAYHVDNNTIMQDAISNNIVNVFPTTMGKFDDRDLSSFRYQYSGQKVNFLTNNTNRYYNYGEVCGLSVMTDKNISLLKKYYTVSGKYLGSTNTIYHMDKYGMRTDFYFENDIETVEGMTNKQVGYVDVVAVYEGEEITNPVRYNVVPKCNQNNEIFFVNEVGGIDSFNFLGERVWDTQIDDQNTYFINPTRKYSVTRELELIGQKLHEVEHHLTSSIIDYDTAKWLGEMAKSKYPFLFINKDGILFERIVIKDMDIELSDRENTFEIELTYQNGDANIKL